MQQTLLGIHNRAGSYSDRWSEYCREHKIPFRTVNAFSSELIDTVRNLQAYLWHWGHDDFASTLVARQIVMALESMGLKVFPNTNTSWHFDDKIAQKYLLEAIAAPLAPTWIFYNFNEAMEWIARADFPKVFKLRKGAGSSNVRLVATRDEARRLCRTAFSDGFEPVPSYLSDWRTKMRKTKTRSDIFKKISRFPVVLRDLTKRRGLFPKEKNYLYFQEYMPGNEYDVRITVIGNRAFGFVRKNRPGDFRASGSGAIDYDLKAIDPEFVRIAFEISTRIGAQSLAMDFVRDIKRQPVLLEMSYVFVAEAVYACAGHWDRDFNWHAGHMWPQDAIIEDILNTL